MKQRSFKAMPGLICIIFFRVIAETFIQELVTMSASVCGLITGFY